MPSMFGRFRKALFGGQPEVKSVSTTHSSNMNAALNMAIRGIDTAVNVDAKVKLVTSNPTAFQCVRRIAWAVSSVPWLVDGKDTGQLPELLNKTVDAAETSRFEIWNQAAQSLGATGNAFIKKTSGIRNRPVALHFMRPDRVTVETDARGNIDHYTYSPEGESQEKMDVDKVIHIRHPWLNDDHIGISVCDPLFDILMMWDGYAKLKRKLLENSGGIPMALVFEGEEALSEKQREEIDEIFSDFRLDGPNFGKILTIDAGTFKGKVNKITLAGDIKSLDPKESVDDLERNIATMFGVPRLLLGVGGDATYANQREARRYFWLDTVVPGYIKPIASALSQALDAEVSADLDNVPALADFRMEAGEKMGKMDHLTDNEKREFMGYERYETKRKDGEKDVDRGPADMLYKPASLIPIEDPQQAAQGPAQGDLFDTDDEDAIEPDAPPTNDITAGGRRAAENEGELALQ